MATMTSRLAVRRGGRLLISATMLSSCMGRSALDLPPAPVSASQQADAGVDAAPEGGPAPACEAGSTRPCYSGAPETLDVGVCRAGIETCLRDGSGFGACEGEIVPRAEDCVTAADEDCDGVQGDPEDGCGLTMCTAWTVGLGGAGTKQSS